MSDVILYKKQKEQLSKAVSKALDAQAELVNVLNSIGVSIVGKSASVSTDDASSKVKGPKKAPKVKTEKTEKKASRASEDFTEM